MTVGKDLFPDDHSDSRPTVRLSDRPSALSVTELLEILRGSVESAARHVWVKGEVTSLKAYGSGHWYFTLRDKLSSIRCIMWKTYTVKFAEPPAEGTEVYALGNPTIWAKSGDLKMGVVVMLPTAGVGVQMLGKERVRAALEKDGLFALDRKRPLPEFPASIAVVTSQDGAALHDMIIVARRRWPSVRIVFVPAQVQGDEAPRALVRALGIVNRLKKVDLCIIGRGGGARDDLHAFDHEKVCRALAELRVPSISAVGHETDVSLCDLVADVRAATPSAAMELALPDRRDCLRHAVSLGSRLANGLKRRTGVVTARLARSGDRMRVAISRRVTQPRANLERMAGQLEALSPLKVLGRGYSVARLAGGRVARRRVDLPPGTQFTLRVIDGDVPSHVDS